MKETTLNTDRKIVANIIRTPDGTVLQSKNRHDYVTHVDTLSKETYMVDGGLSYLRRSLNKMPYLELSIYEDDSHSVKREWFMWGSIGGEWRKLKDLSNTHLEAIIETQYQIRGTHVYRMMMDELEYRSKSGFFVKEY